MKSSSSYKPNHTLLIFGDRSVGKSTFLKNVTNSNPDRLLVLVDKVQNTSITLKTDEGPPEGKIHSSICMIFMYDITQPATLSKLSENYSHLLKDKDLKERCFLVLLGNKSDLENQRKVQAQEGEIFASQYGMFFLEVSNVTRKNLELLQKVVRIRVSHLLKKNDIPGSETKAEKLETQPLRSGLARHQAHNEEDKKAVVSEPAEVNKQNPHSPVPQFRLDLKNRDIERRERWTKLESSVERNHINTPLSDKFYTDGTKQSSSPGNRRQTTSPGKDSFSDMYPNRVTPRKEEKPVPPTSQNLYNSNSRSSQMQEILGDRLFEPLRSGDSKENLQHKSYSKTGASPRLERNLQSHLERPWCQPRVVQNVGLNEIMGSYPKSQEHFNDMNQNRTQPPMPSPSSLGDNNWSKEPLIGTTKRTLSSQTTRGGDSSRRQLPENLTVTSNVNSSSPIAVSRRDISQITPQFREKYGQNAYPHFQNHGNAQYLKYPTESCSLKDHVEPISLPKLGANREYNNVSFSQKGSHTNELSGLQPKQNNSHDQNLIKLHKVTASPFTNRENLSRPSVNGRLDEEPKPEEYHQTATANQHSRSIERTEYVGNMQRIAERNSDSRLKQRQSENISSIKANEDFQFISIGTSDNSSISKTHINQEHNEDIKQSISSKRQPILSEIDQNIKRLEASLSNIDIKMAEQGRNTTRGRRTTIGEKDIFNRKTENRVLRETGFQDENDYRITEDIEHTNTRRKDSMSRSLNQFNQTKNSQQNLINPRKTLNFEDFSYSDRKSNENRQFSAERKTSNQRYFKNDKGLGYSNMNQSNSAGKASTIGARNTFRDKNKPILYIHLEDAQGNVNVVPVYSEDSPMTVAERYLDYSGSETSRGKLQKLSELIEDKINAASFEVETFISKYQEQPPQGKGTPNSAKLETSLKKGKNFNLGTYKRILAKKQEDVLVGKLYVELQNRRIVVLNLRQSDDLSDAAIGFLNTHSLNKQYYHLIYSHLQQLKQMVPKNLEHMEENYPILNLVLKDCKFLNRKSLSPIPSRLSIDDVRSTTPSRNSIIRRNSSVLYKMNVDTGNGKIAKMIVKEGDNLQKVAHNFVITHKMGPGSYDKVLQLLLSTSRNKAESSSAGKNINRLMY